MNIEMDKQACVKTHTHITTLWPTTHLMIITV